MKNLKIVTLLFLAFSFIYAIDPPTNVRVHGSSDSSAIIDWTFDESKGNSDGFIVKYIDEHRQSECSSPVTINRLTKTSARIAPKRKQVSEKYIDSSRQNSNEYDDERKQEESSFPWWILIPLILLPLLAILGYLLWKKSQKTKSDKTIVTHHDKQWEEKRLYIQQQRNATLELEKRNEEIGYEIAKARRARLEEEHEALKLENSRLHHDNLGAHRQQQHDKQFIAYKS
uniref:Fibronectin type-III domain-containing protein n=1 Tax=Panagrolaimus sp. ES5 TaxID=591445 RepID=A0AC34FIA2_9BILA